MVQNHISELCWLPNDNYLAYVPYELLYDSNYYGIIKVVEGNGNNVVQVSPLINDGGMGDICTELYWSPESNQLAFEIAYPHPNVIATVGMTEL